jgi:predicted ester cyclase
MAQPRIKEGVMSADENTAVVRRLHELTNQHDLAAVEALFGPTYVFHNPNLPLGRTRADRTQAAMAAQNDFPDLQWQPDEVIAAGDTVVSRWTFRGTHTPTGKPVTMTGITIYHFFDGKIVEQWDEYDSLGMQRQLGLLPPTEQAREAGA